MMKKLAEIDLQNIEDGAKRDKPLIHPADTLKLVAEVRRLRGEELAPLLTRIADDTEKDLENKGIWELFGSAAEELGELSAEMMIEEKVFGHANKKVDEGSKAEAVDLTICALALFFARGGTVKDLVEIGNRKLTKWEESQKESKNE